MRTVFLIGSETPMDLLLLSLFFRKKPAGDFIVGVRRDNFLNRKKISKILEVLKNQGLYFVGFNIMLNSSKCRVFMQNCDVIPSNIEALKKQYKFPLFYFDNVNAQETISIIKEFAPDLILNHMPQRIRFPLIGLPSCGIVNIHPGLLPDYQGMGSCLWPLINSSPFHGTTLHYIDSEEIDVGPIITVGRFPISKNDTVLSLHIKNRIVGSVLANYVTDRYFRNEQIKSKLQSGGKYYKLPRKEELHLMRNSGHSYFALSDRKIINDNQLNQFDFYDEKTGWEWKPWPIM